MWCDGIPQKSMPLKRHDSNSLIVRVLTEPGTRNSPSRSSRDSRSCIHEQDRLPHQYTNREQGSWDAIVKHFISNNVEALARCEQVSLSHVVFQSQAPRPANIGSNQTQTHTHTLTHTVRGSTRIIRASKLQSPKARTSTRMGILIMYGRRCPWCAAGQSHGWHNVP